MIKIAICEVGTTTSGTITHSYTGYISKYDYKINREDLSRARLWKNHANVDKYLQTDSYRRLAKYVTRDLEIREIEDPGNGPFNRQVLRTIRTIPLADVQAAAGLASTRAERRARGLKR